MRLKGRPKGGSIVKKINKKGNLSMSNVLTMSKRAVTYVTVVATILWAVGFSAIAGSLTANAAEALEDGKLYKRADLTTVYYVQDGGRYVFPNSATFLSWYGDFDSPSITTVSADSLAAVPLVDNITLRPGTWFGKITSDEKVYAITPGGVLRWVKTGEDGDALYGENWLSGRLVDIPDGFFPNYTIGEDLTSADGLPDGSYVKDGDDYYYMEDGKKRMVDSAAMAGNGFMSVHVWEADLASVEAGDALGEFELSDTAQTGAEVTPPVPTSGGNLSISVASGSPDADSVVTDNTSGSTLGQRMAPMLLADFTANGGDVEVDTVAGELTGISKDGDVDEVYLMDGDTILAKTNSISEGVIEWTDNFTVSGTMPVWVRLDVNKSATNGGTIGVKITGATLEGTGSVSGSAAGANMTVAQVSDLGYLEIATSSPTSATTVDAKVGEEKELGKFKFDAVDQDILVKSVTFTQIGSVDSKDLKNISLEVAGEQFGATHADLGDDELMFDFTGHADGGLAITSGQSKFLDIRGEIAAGTNRTFQFSIQNDEDVRVWEKEYGVYAPVVSDNTTAFTVETTAQTTINTGSLTIQVADDSPTDDIPDGASNVLLGKWDLTASGEDVKLTSLSVGFGSGDSNNVIKNAKILLDGTQVGTTVASSTAHATIGSTIDADFTFSNNFVVKAGESSVLEAYVDTTGSGIDSGNTLFARLEAGSSNAQGKTSLTSISTSQTAAHTVTVSSGTPTLVENTTLADGAETTNPTAVLNAKYVTVSSFVIKAGSGEGSKITNITLKAEVDDTGNDGLAGGFINMRLRHNGEDIAPAKGTLTTGDTDTFDYTLTNAIELAKGEQYTVDIVADIKSTTSTDLGTVSDTDGVVYPSSVTYQTLETGQSGTASMSAGLQNLFIAVSGSLEAAISADTPNEHYMAMGAADQELVRWKFSAGKPEDVKITELTAIIASVTGSTAVTGVVGNLRLMDGDSQVGQAVASLDTTNVTAGAKASSTAYAKFSNLSLIIPRNSSKTLKLMADITSQPDSLSSSTFIATLINDYDTSDTDSLVSRGANSGTSITPTGIDEQVFAAAAGNDLNGNTMHPLKAVLSIAHASDAPSGSVSKGDDQTIAKWVLSNASNANNQEITLKLLNFKLDTSISQAAGGSNDRELKVYKKNISAANILNTASGTSYEDSFTAGAIGLANDNTAITAANFTNVTIESGQDETIIVTLDTDDADANETLTLGLVLQPNAGGTVQQGIVWSDGYTGEIYDLKPTSSGVGGLPFSGKTLTY